MVRVPTDHPGDNATHIYQVSIDYFATSYIAVCMIQLSNKSGSQGRAPHSAWKAALYFIFFSLGRLESSRALCCVVTCDAAQYAYVLLLICQFDSKMSPVRIACSRNSYYTTVKYTLRFRCIQCLSLSANHYVSATIYSHTRDGIELIKLSCCQGARERETPAGRVCSAGAQRRGRLLVITEHEH